MSNDQKTPPTPVPPKAIPRANPRRRSNHRDSSAEKLNAVVPVAKIARAA